MVEQLFYPTNHVNLWEERKGDCLTLRKTAQCQKTITSGPSLINFQKKYFFVPGIGVASLMEGVQVTRYELIYFINRTKIMMEGIKEELRGLRLTALQNRLVLDQLTAERVCVIVGETCCTYIPDNGNEGHVIEEGIKKLTFMSKTLTDRETTSGFFGLEWFKGIFTNVTYVMLMVICTVCSGLLILCLWPCIRALIRNAVSSTFKSSTAGAQSRLVAHFPRSRPRPRPWPHQRPRPSICYRGGSELKKNSFCLACLNVRDVYVSQQKW